MSSTSSDQSDSSFHSSTSYCTARDNPPDHGTARAHMTSLLKTLDVDAAEAPQFWADRDRYLIRQVLQTNEDYDGLDHAYESLRECYDEAVTNIHQKNDKIQELDAALQQLRLREDSLIAKLDHRVEENDRLTKEIKVQAANARADASRQGRLYNTKAEECDQLRQQLLDETSMHVESAREVDYIRGSANATSSSHTCANSTNVQAQCHGSSFSVSELLSAPNRSVKSSVIEQRSNSVKDEDPSSSAANALCAYVGFPSDDNQSNVFGIVEQPFTNSAEKCLDFSKHKIPSNPRETLNHNPLALVKIVVPADWQNPLQRGSQIHFDADMIERLEDQ